VSKLEIIVPRYSVKSIDQLKIIEELDISKVEKFTFSLTNGDGAHAAKYIDFFVNWAEECFKNENLKRQNVIFFGGLLSNTFLLVERNLPKNTSQKVMEFNNVLANKFKYDSEQVLQQSWKSLVKFVESLEFKIF